jgi:hypothetical protein
MVHGIGLTGDVVQRRVKQDASVLSGALQTVLEKLGERIIFTLNPYP